MAVRGIQRVKNNLRLKVRDISQRRTEAAVYAVLSQGAALAQTMVPIDTGNLANSQYAPQIQVESNRVMGSVGYTALYAGAVHDAPGKLLGTSTPRDSGDPSRGNVWDPNAEPGFLSKGFEKLMPAVPNILRSVYGGSSTA